MVALAWPWPPMGVPAALAERAWPLLADAPTGAISSEDYQAIVLGKHTSPVAAWNAITSARGLLEQEAFAAADRKTQLAALAARSTELTFPLTIAHAWRSLRAAIGAPRRPIRICVVGALAEAALQPCVWGELALLLDTSALSLEFCGPHCRLPPNRDYTTSDGERSVRIAEAYGVGHRTCFHSGATGQALLRAYAAPGSRLPSQVEALLPDAYVLFNPGLGTDARGADWIPTVRALLAARRPLLLTALDKSDAVRDEAVMSTELERWHAKSFRESSQLQPVHPGRDGTREHLGRPVGRLGQFLNHRERGLACRGLISPYLGPRARMAGHGAWETFDDMRNLRFVPRSNTASHLSTLHTLPVLRET